MWWKQKVEHDDVLLSDARMLAIQEQGFVTGAVVVDFGRMFYDYSGAYLPTRELQVLLSVLAARNQDENIREMLVICCDSIKGRDGSDAVSKGVFTKALFDFEGVLDELGADVPFCGFYGGMRSGRIGGETSGSGYELYSVLCCGFDLSVSDVTFVGTGLTRLADAVDAIFEGVAVSTRHPSLYDWIVAVEGYEVADTFAKEFKAKASSGERTVADWLVAHGIEFEREVTFDSCRDKKPLPFDFLVYGPQDVLIEFDGKQHFESVEYFGGDERLEYVARHDAIKTKWANEQGIRLLRIRWDEDIDLVLSAEFLDEE